MNFLGAGLEDTSAVRAQIAESWQRSRRAGVDASRFEVPYEPDLDFDGSLAACAVPVLDHLTEQLSGSPMSVVLTDADGRVLDRRVGEGELRRRLDDISLAPGFSYAEQHAGTNGVGTALEGRTAALVVGAEHFTDLLQPFACAGAPIHQPVSHELVGILDITCLRGHVNDLMPVLAVQAAREIEHVLLDRGSRGAHAVMAEFEAACARSPNPVVALADDFLITNRAARAQLDAGDGEELRVRAGEYLQAPAAGADRVLLGAGPARLHFTPVPTSPRPRGVVMEVVFSTSTLRLAADGAAQLPSRRADTRSRAPAGLVGASPAWLASCRALRDAAEEGRPTLVLGETGTGKSAAVRATHLEARSRGRLVVLDGGSGVAAARAALADATAIDRAPGGVVTGGTGDAAATLVVRHLERIDEGEAAALADLFASPHEKVRGRRWLVGIVTGESLDPGSPAHPLLRTFEISVVVEPLRRRPDDVPLLVESILGRLAPRRRVQCSPEAGRLLAGGLWPGNVTELEDVLRRALARRPVGDIGPQDLPGDYAACRSRHRLSLLETVERDLIVNALVEAGGNRMQAAAALGMGRATLYRRLKAFGITDVGR